MKRRESDRPTARAGDPSRLRGPARGRRPLPARRDARIGARAARGDPLRRADQLAAAAQALRHRPGGRARRHRHRGGAPTCRASARICRTISNSISRWRRSSRSRSTRHTGLVARGLVGLRWLMRGRRPRGHQPFRGRRLHPQPGGRALSRYPVSTSCRWP